MTKSLFVMSVIVVYIKYVGVHLHFIHENMQIFYMTSEHSSTERYVTVAVQPNCKQK